MSKPYVLDTSAFITLTLDEKGSDDVVELISLGRQKRVILYASFVTLTEIYYTVYHNQSENAAKEAISFIKTLPIEVVYPNDILALSAGRIKAQHHLSLADAFVAATAFEKNATLVHKDPEFESLSQSLKTMALPYKK